MPRPSEATALSQARVPEEPTQCSRSLLAGLLQNSEELPKESFEVTPIQAWHQIARHVRFDYLNMHMLQKFADQLLEHIKCYGCVDSTWRREC